MLNSVIQLHDSNSDVTKLWDLSLSLWGHSWLKIKGFYIHLSSNVAPSLHVYTSDLTDDGSLGFSLWISLASCSSIDLLWISPSSACVTSTSCLGYPNTIHILEALSNSCTHKYISSVKVLKICCLTSVHLCQTSQTLHDPCLLQAWSSLVPMILLDLL